MSKLGFFPTPYPDELFYSICARYICWEGIDNSKSGVMALFGTKDACAVHDLPSRFGDLCNRFSEGSLLTPEFFINEHTLFRLYQPFLPIDRASKLYEWMLGNENGKDIHKSVGLFASGIKTLSYLRFCPKCYEEDEALYFEPYWHRSHQVPGVVVCHKHGCPLKKSTAPVSGQVDKRAFHPLGVETSRKATAFIVENVGCSLEIARSSHWLLTHSLESLSLDQIHDKYNYLVGRHGFATYSGRVKQTEFRQAFIDYYGADFLKSICCNVKIDTEYSWLAGLVRKRQKASHPLRHFLLMGFLGYTPQQFFETTLPSFLPFGEAPYPCLNPVCKDYKNSVIKTVKISRNCKNGRPIGSFRCECGFEYIRTGPDTSPSDRLLRSNVVEFGPLWERYLVELKQTGLSYAVIGEALGVSGNTVRSHWLQSQGENNGKTQKQELKYDEFIQKRDAKRKQWQQQVKDNPDLSRTDLRNKVPAICAWLYKNDNAWLDANSPAKLSVKRKPEEKRVDWIARDLALSGGISSAAERVKDMINHRGKLVQVTRKAIARELGMVALIEKNLHRLPETTAAIETHAESLEDFQIRRAGKLIEDLWAKGLAPQPWEVQIKAGLGPAASSNVFEFVRQKLEGSLR